MSTITVQVFKSVFCIDPIRTVSFGSVNEAKDYMFSDENKTTPMEALRGYMPIARNFPNVRAGTVDSREKAIELWRSGDSTWIMHDSPA